MANVKLNPAFESIRGKVGDLVFKTFEGREIVASMPDFGDRVFTDAQKAAQERFRRPGPAAPRR